MCELKLNPKYKDISTTDGHTLTGVWVEISSSPITGSSVTCHTLTGVWVEMMNLIQFLLSLSHTLTGVWVEISLANDIEIKKSGHTLTGVWVEILHDCKFTEIVGVTPSRVCELKYT